MAPAMSQATDPRESVRSFLIAQNRWHEPRERLTDDHPLLTSGVIDSLGLIRLVGFLESEFGIRVDDRELVPSNFGTIASIAAFIESAR
jgi:acyl carrier protein